jgi:AcrR family transcriptional regulator
VPRTGRPSIAPERRTHLIESFIRLVGVRGLDSVTLDDVAAESGIARANIRHFVGNRQDLVKASVGHLAARYEVAARTALGPAPSVDALLAVLFGPTWVTDQADADLAFDALLVEASVIPDLAGAFRRVYEVLVEEIERALRVEYPRAPAGRRRDTAYAIACLAEHNVDLQRLGFPAARSAGARAAAATLAGSLAG